MSRDDWLACIVIGLLSSFAISIVVLVGAPKGRPCRTHGAGVRWPVDVPGTMTVGDVDYAFSPTGGYVHVTYKPKEESR